MSWIDRLKEAAYNSPAGARLTFSYENVSKFFEKKGSAFEFTSASGTYVQPLGKSGDRFPLLCIFHGEDHDTEAQTFMDALGEDGIGKLEHPFYGEKNVIPIGTIRQRDDLKTAANQSIIEVTFWETISGIYPAVGEDITAVVVQNINSFTEAASEEFSASVDAISSVEQAAAEGFFSRILSNVTESLEEITKIQEELQEQLKEKTGPLKDAFDNTNSVFGSINAQFDSILSSIITGLDRAFLRPATLARQVLRLVQTPGRAFSTIGDKFLRYRNIIDRLVAQGTATLSPGGGNEARNNFYISDMFATAAISGAVTAAVSSAPSSGSIVTGEGLIQFQTRTQAIEAAEELLQMLEDVTVWRENNFQALEEIDTGESYQTLHRIATLGAGALIGIAFNLKQERSVVLDRNRNMIELEYQLYGTVGENIDLLISSNNLTGSEMLELKTGKEILYYV